MGVTDQVYEFVLSFRAEHQVSPTVREVMQGVGLSSTSQANRHLVKLVEEGRLRRAMNGRSTRCLIPVEAVHA